MLKESKGNVATCALVLVATLSIAASCIGCASATAPAEEELPATHVDAQGEVATDHARCGACHSGAHRGLAGWDAIEAPTQESESARDFDLPDPSPQPDEGQDLTYEQIFIDDSEDQAQQL